MPAAMLVWPAVRSWLIAKLRRVAMLSGPWPVRILEASFAESGVADEMQPVLDRPLWAGQLTEPLGDAWRVVRSVSA